MGGWGRGGRGRGRGREREREEDLLAIAHGTVRIRRCTLVISVVQSTALDGPYRGTPLNAHAPSSICEDKVVHEIGELFRAITRASLQSAR
jgi:hypothetical protein